MTKFIRVSVVGAKPVTHITITEASFRPAKHRLLKSEPLDRNGKPRPAKFAPNDSHNPGNSPATTTGQEATE